MNHDFQRTQGLWGQIREDLRSHPGGIMAPGFQAMAAYRIGVWAGRLPGPLRLFPLCVSRVASLFVRSVYGIELHRTAKVGRRLHIAHQSGIVIHHRAEIGDDCILRQNVTIGQSMGTKGAPKLGNRVDVGAGAVICGNVTIGDDVRIGPNSVVMTDVPEGSTVFVPPAKILQMRKPAKPPTMEAKPSAEIPSTHYGRTAETPPLHPESQPSSGAKHAAD